MLAGKVSPVIQAVAYKMTLPEMQNLVAMIISSKLVPATGICSDQVLQ